MLLEEVIIPSIFKNICKGCGKEFLVTRRSQNDPNNYSKFKRCCSPACTSKLRSQQLADRHASGSMAIPRVTTKRVIDRDTLVDMYCHQRLTIEQIRIKLHAKQPTISAALKHYGLLNVFYNRCPNCSTWFTVRMRCQTDPNSNKFKKFCTTSCFLSSRGHSNTWIERVVQEFLDKANIPYVAQFPIGRMSADFMIPQGKIVIEVNGDFWHANPDIYGKEKPLHKNHARVIEKDKRKLTRLLALGYRVITVWENDLKVNEEATLSSLLQEIKEVYDGSLRITTLSGTRILR